jgi:hypothetical protein
MRRGTDDVHLAGKLAGPQNRKVTGIKGRAMKINPLLLPLFFFF